MTALTILFCKPLVLSLATRWEEFTSTGDSPFFPYQPECGWRWGKRNCHKIPWRTTVPFQVTGPGKKVLALLGQTPCKLLCYRCNNFLLLSQGQLQLFAFILILGYTSISSSWQPMGLQSNCTKRAELSFVKIPSLHKCNLVPRVSLFSAIWNERPWRRGWRGRCLISLRNISSLAFVGEECVMNHTNPWVRNSTTVTSSDLIKMFWVQIMNNFITLSHGHKTFLPKNCVTTK